MPDEENSEGKFRLGKSERMSRQVAKLKYNPHQFTQQYIDQLTLEGP